ncbi:hypothetical protein ACS15_5569 [Ralstonia insidiosa]|uniref:Uncharacterized protein n=1 Tax=Ralstonia insidiosa TaxID=190721 RepID=A0AAC9BM92_9RALS|nr:MULTISPECIES: hypothetical protein [Ralstonia]ANH76626.1 hypothetical protein ACS15_5569 [Ralstonia insidiosa]EPX99514.1 hypothetical protein C404_02885 [Ralstonia sp. AU12-08]MBY4705150.1 hypothetical protein [Ralstonia insidiosa]
MNRTNANHKSNQANPNNRTHRQANNNSSNQGNPNNRAFHSSRNVPATLKK